MGRMLNVGMPGNQHDQRRGERQRQLSLEESTAVAHGGSYWNFREFIVRSRNVTLPKPYQ